MASFLMVLPTPKRVERRSGVLRADRLGCIRMSAGEDAFLSVVADAFKPLGRGRGAWRVGDALEASPHMRLCLTGADGRPPRCSPLPRPLGEEGYRLTIRPASVQVEARTERGLFYGLMTLRQALRNHDPVPCCVIEDWPDMPVRGVHMDLKGCTPTVAYMKRLIPRLAEYKINTLLMEYENAVALEATPGVAKPAAWTKKEMHGLARIARRHHVTLMPLLQTLGHVEYILEHDRYAHLREDPEDVSQYCPSHPDLFPFIRAQAEELMEFFPESKYFHVGADETALLGRCPKCRARMRKGEDKLDIYLGHMNKVWRYVMDKGYTPVFWDDIVARDYTPERMRRIPKGVAVMYWLYSILSEEAYNVRLKGASWGRRELIRHDRLMGGRLSVWPCSRWLEDMPPEVWRRYRSFLDKPEYDPAFHSAPFIEMFQKHGVEVFGASAAKMGGSGVAMTALGDRVDNIRTWARHIARAKETGVVSTAWARNASLTHPYLPIDVMWYSMCASAQFYWSADSTVDAFQAVFDRDFFGLDDKGRLAQALEAVGLPQFSAAAAELDAARVARNRDVLRAYQLNSRIERQRNLLMALLDSHAKGAYLVGRGHMGNRNIHSLWLKDGIREYLKLEKPASAYCHRVMLPDEADELLEAEFRFFKEADLRLA